MYILGISAFYHDSAAVLIKNGKVICAVEEERFSRIKHDNSFPFLAVKRCLEYAGITINEVSAIAYYEKPLLKFERILENIVRDFPFSLRTFNKSVPEWLGQKIKVGEIIKNKLKFKKDVYYIPHHLSHASAAFYPSPFKQSAILTIDGIGEYQTLVLWSGDETQIKQIKSLEFPNSLGLIYSLFTSFLGFKVNEDEYKVMGLSAYGKPQFKPQIYELIDLKPDGSFKLNHKYFNFENDKNPWTADFTKLFGLPKSSNEPFRTKHKNIAASIQAVTEEIYFKILNQLYLLTNSENICIGGGVALNALANGKIYTNTEFKNSFVFGAAGDSGGALGAALFTWHTIYKNNTRNEINSLNMGTDYNDISIQQALIESKLNYRKFTSQTELIEKTALLLSEGKILGWFENRMEFGPRALGGRSILANPSGKTMKSKVNTVKYREQFRPFAGSVLQEKVHELFEVPERNHYSPFMTYCFKVKPSQKKLLEAITHVDYTCRVQTVSKSNGLYYQLIKQFSKLTGISCILNTSFNLAGEPLVESPLQAINDFQNSKLEYLIMGNFLIKKPGP